MTDIVYNKNGIPFDIDAIATDLNGKMDKDGINATASVCVETYQNGTSWYRVYSDGWCEQGGQITGLNSSASTYNVSLLKTYKDTSYNIVCWDMSRYSSSTPTYIVATKLTTGFNGSYSGIGSSDGGSSGKLDWQACGYIR
jgi:hypothetical protein